MKWWNRQKLLFSYNFPFYTYLQVWRYFKIPKLNFVFNKMENHLMELGLPTNRKKSWFAKHIFRSHNSNVIYKQKEYYVAYEFPPQINWVFFDKYQFLMRWFAPDEKHDYLYWETIASFLDWHKTHMYECVQNNTWKSYLKDGSELPLNVYTLNFLTRKGRKMYEKEKKLQKNLVD